MLQVKDKYNQQLLNGNGYFTIPFLNASEIEKIKSIYYAHFIDKETSFYSTSFHPNIQLKKKVNDAIISIVQQKLEETFDNYKIIGSSFLKKNPNENNPLPLHQDWTVTDEDKFGSYTIWIPLQDTTPHNGAIRVIPGSHQVENNFRAPSLPVAFEKERTAFNAYLKTLPLAAGEAFIFNQKLMHASFPNSSNTERLAVTIGILPKAANLFMLYFDSNKKQLSKYAMPDDLFLHYPEIIQQPKIGTLIETIPYSPSVFTEKMFLEKAYQNRQQYSTMQPLFKNTEHQAFFEKNGYIKLPALNTQQVNELRDYYFNSGIKKTTDYGFYVGMDHENKQLVDEMMQKIESVAMASVSNYLAPYQLITASYVIKDTNNKGVVPPHQDWTFVEDETKHCSVTCWIPLVDTTMENGCLGVIKGSQKFFNNVRPSPSPQVPSPLAAHLFSLFPYFDLIPMKAGEALIFDNRTFHASPPNITEEPRLAVGLSFTQKDAVLRHYYLKPGTKDVLLKYEVTPEFFKQYDNGTLSKMYDAGKIISEYKLLEEIPYKWENLSKDDMKKRVVEAGNAYNKELTNHMMKLFGSQMKDSFSTKIKNVLSLPKHILNKVLR